jgi:hypothetical protein
LTGTLTTAGAISTTIRTAKSLSGTLTSAGTLASAQRIPKALTGTLTSSGTTSGVYIPPTVPDDITLRLRRNQTD